MGGRQSVSPMRIAGRNSPNQSFANKGRASPNYNGSKSPAYGTKK